MFVFVFVPEGPKVVKLDNRARLIRRHAATSDVVLHPP